MAKRRTLPTKKTDIFDNIPDRRMDARTAPRLDALMDYKRRKQQYPEKSSDSMKERSSCLCFG